MEDGNEFIEEMGNEENDLPFPLTLIVWKFWAAAAAKDKEKEEKEVCQILPDFS